MQFRCGGKIFILGEYACIEGGPSILETLAPHFALKIVRDETRQSHKLPFAGQSPAGLFLEANRELLQGVRIEWLDPYDTPIGVGSSSAQFLMSVAAIAKLANRPLPNPETVLHSYWDTVGASQGLRPSGVDVIAQWMGGPIVLRNEPFTSRSLPVWKGASKFVLAHTGVKAKTHEHLKTLQDRGFPGDFKEALAHLNEITLGAIEAWETGNEQLLGSAMNAYQASLLRGGLADINFTRQIEAIQKWPGVLGCKGSGAQGGDCVLLLVNEANLNAVGNELRALGWTPILPQWTHDGLTQIS